MSDLYVLYVVHSFFNYNSFIHRLSSLLQSIRCLGLSLSVLFANGLVLAFSATGIIVAELEWWDILIVSACDIVIFFVVDGLKVGYQSWLKSSGVGTIIEDSGRGFKRESGSFLGNRCCEFLRCVFCIEKPPPEGTAHGDSLSSGSESAPLIGGSGSPSSSSSSSSGPVRRNKASSQSATEVRTQGGSWAASFFQPSSGASGDRDGKNDDDDDDSDTNSQESTSLLLGQYVDEI